MNDPNGDQQKYLLREDLWYIQGKAYDLEEFAKRHPGGDIIYRGRGLDCTSLFYSYHTLKQPDLALFQKFRVPKEDLSPKYYQIMKDNNIPEFTFEDNGFYQTVRKRVVRYFAETKQDRCAPLYYRIFLLGMTLLSIVLMYFSHVKGSLLCAVLYGFVKAEVAIHVGHGIGHYSVFKSPKSDLFWGRVAQLFTVSTEDIWTLTHNISHHSFSMTPADEQTKYSWKRTQPWLKQQLPNLQKYQHYYIWLIYIFGALLWGTQDLVDSVIELLFTKRNRLGLRSSLAMQLSNVFVCSFILFTSIALPFFFHSFAWAALLATVVTVVTSTIVVFQIVVNHEEDVVLEPLRKTEYPTKIDWGLHQMNTSVNFASTSFLWLQLSGGLNMQLEHHLFPSVHHLHYPAIRKIVMEVAKEQGAQYLEFDTILDAVASHYRALKMGAECDKDFMSLYFSKSR